MKRKLLIAGTILLALLVCAFLWPLPKELRLENLKEPTRIEDRNGNLLYEVRSGNERGGVPLKKIPLAIQQALIQTEDRTFSSHQGLSLRGIARAMLRNAQAGEIREGGSTITQQLVRTLLPAQRRGVLPKLRESWLALKIDFWYSKDEILETFLNTAFFGNHAYGVDAAAKTYFNANASNLSLAESAMLIGLLNAPSALNPFKNPAGAVERRNTVLFSLRETKTISSGEYEEATEEPFSLVRGRVPIRAPHFVFWLLQEHPEILQEKHVRTTVDLDLQFQIEESIARQIERLRDKNVTSGAAVVLDTRTGDILAMVGSADYFEEEHDGAVNVATSLRQPGSALKPFTYAEAFAQGLTPSTTVSDTEARYGTAEGTPYTPRNYDYEEHGLVRLREALANSYNIAAVRVLERVGVESLYQLLKNAGITSLTNSPEYYGLALTLGDSEVTLLELTSAYGMFARRGTTLTPRALLSSPEAQGKEVLDPRIAWLISDILSDDEARAPEFGRGGPLEFDFPVAAKTGTTRNSRDNWTIGFTPDYVVGVWVGNADNTPMRGTSGVTGAGPIFHEVMLVLQSGKPSEFVRPSGIVDEVVCTLSGKLPTSLCSGQMTEHFLEEHPPREQDDIFVEVRIDTRNGLLASEDCAEHLQREVFALFPLESRAWARERGFQEPPVEYSPLCAPHNVQALENEDIQILRIRRPGANASFLLDPLIPDENEQIVFEAEATMDIQEVEWSVDDKRVCTGYAPVFRCLWKPKVGNFHIEARSGNKKDSVEIEVLK